MSRTAKQSVALFLLMAVVGVLAWRLWPDGRQARQQEQNLALLQAVRSNDLAAATRLLKAGADPNSQAAPLSFIQKIKWDYLEVLHGRKALTWSQINAINASLPVLQIAVMRGKLSMVRVLLSKGADVKHRDELGNTSLSWAERLKGGSKFASDTHDRLCIAALLEAADARRKAPNAQ